MEARGMGPSEEAGLAGDEMCLAGKGLHQQAGLSTGAVSDDNELAAELGHGGGSREMKGVGKSTGWSCGAGGDAASSGGKKQSRGLEGREKAAVDGDEGRRG
jgi:hypothetical protein